MVRQRVNKSSLDFIRLQSSNKFKSFDCGRRRSTYALDVLRLDGFGGITKSVDHPFIFCKQDFTHSGLMKNTATAITVDVLKTACETSEAAI